MLTKFKTLLNENKNKSDLIDISKIIQDEITNIENNDNNNFLYDKFDQIVLKLSDFYKLKKTTIKELSRLKTMFKYISKTYDQCNYHIAWEYMYEFNSCKLCVGYNGDDEGEGCKYFYFGDFIKIKNIESTIQDEINQDELKIFYKKLKLKYVSLYIFLELLISVSTYFCEDCGDFSINIERFYEDEIKKTKYQNMQNKFGSTKLFEKMFPYQHNSIDVNIENFDITKNVINQNFKTEYTIVHDNYRSIIYMDDKNCVYESHGKKQNKITINEENEDFFNLFFKTQ